MDAGGRAKQEPEPRVPRWTSTPPRIPMPHPERGAGPRYISRPAVAAPRLSLSSTGKVVYTRKTPYRDGTTQVALEPMDFVARLAALVPKPRANGTGTPSPATMAFSPARPGSIHLVEVCDRCGGSVRVIASIEDQDVIDRILTHLRQKEQETPTRPLLVPPSRAPLGTLPLFAGKDSSTTALHQQGSQ